MKVSYCACFLPVSDIRKGLGFCWNQPLTLNSFSWFLAFSETLGLWPVGSLEWLSQTGKSPDVVPPLLSSLPPELGLSPFLLCVHFVQSMALCLLELTHSCSLFTHHLSHSFTLLMVNVIIYLSLNLPSYCLFSTCSTGYISFLK